MNHIQVCMHVRLIIYSVLVHYNNHIINGHYLSYTSSLYTTLYRVKYMIYMHQKRTLF